MDSKIVYVAGEFPFPEGNASTERIRNIAYGFVENGYKVVIIPILPYYTEFDNLNELASYDNNLSYVRHDIKRKADSDRSTKIKNQSNWDKLKWFIGSYKKSMVFSRNLDKKCIVQPQSIAFLYGRSFVKLKGLFDLFKKNDCLVVFDLVEIPESFNGFGGKFNPIYWDWKFASKFFPQRSFGLTAISQFIYDRYKQSNGNIIIAPATTKIDDFEPNFVSWSNRTIKMLYLGALVVKDAPDYMFEVISRYSEKYPDLVIELIVAGRYNQTTSGREWVKYVEHHDILKDVVTFRGELSNEEMELELANCDTIILLRRNSEIECASFPTRLVEFLRSGRPLISSDFGDVGHYLEHAEDSILLPVDNAESSADILHAVLTNDSAMESMAKNGFSTLSKFFNREDVVDKVIRDLKLPQSVAV